MKKEHRAELIDNKSMNSDSSLLVFRCPEIAEESRPGQFVNVSCSKFLKRPFGVNDTDSINGTFSIGVREVGEGSAEIRSLEPGALVDVLGPLGNYFPLENAKKLIMVGGGTGVYPLHFALKEARKANVQTIYICGFRCVSDSCLVDECEAFSDRFMITSDTGDVGIRGTVMDALYRLNENEYNDATVLSVGPEIMMKNVSQWAENIGLDCFVSLERRMACGIGMCLVCTCKIKTKNHDDLYENKRCCADGPIFNSREVVW
ncbi:MAG: dihydroorotate dehydrogenase electron transfer subunit [Clostridiaceae bacterium]|nr:dihydroorotate dehydrogenase electron transfer subunit [Clostridiaceae bacterium]